MSTAEEKTVTVKLVTDRLSTILQLEVRVYITTNFDYELIMVPSLSRRSTWVMAIRCLSGYDLRGYSMLQTSLPTTMHRNSHKNCPRIPRAGRFVSLFRKPNSTVSIREESVHGGFLYNAKCADR